jgi:peroxiredoxin
MAQFRDHYAEFRELQAEIYGISADSHFAQAAWGRELGLPFPQLSDWEKTVARTYDMLLDELIGYREVPDRGVVMIDRQGIVIYRDRVAQPRDLPNVQAVLAHLRARAGQA